MTHKIFLEVYNEECKSQKNYFLIDSGYLIDSTALLPNLS